jgi:hypothetical protein
VFSSLEGFYGTGFAKPVNQFTADLSDSVALRVYSSTRPRNLKIASLQKGLIFVHEGMEQVGEGGGFGLPILIYEDETYFSGSSIVSVDHYGMTTRIFKEFLMDHVNRSSFMNVTLHSRKVRSVMRRLAELYQNNKRLQFLALRELSLSLGVESVYLKVPAVCKLLVCYEIKGQSVKVTVDYSQADRRGLEKVVVLNEQSGTFFRFYRDSTLPDFVDEIPAWERVTSQWACLLNPQRNIGYRLWDVENSSLIRGRESLADFLDWAGLDYEFLPRRSVFEYEIQFLGVNS